MTEITVTQQDIDNGIRALCYACPIAWAAFRATGKITEVGSDFMFLRGKKRGLPEEACQFIADFDSGRAVKPFSFKVK